MRRLMTYRQLAKWLAQGNGQVKYFNEQRVLHISTYFDYCPGIPTNVGIKWADSSAAENIFVRPWDSNEWILPTTDLLDSHPEDLV